MGKRAVTYPLQTIALLLFFVLAVVPVLYTLILTFAPGGPLREGLSSFGTDMWLLLARSVALALSVAFLSTLLGTAAAFLLNKTPLPLRAFFRVALLIPLFLSPYLLAVAWKDFFFLFFGTTSFISSAGGVVLVMTTIYTPLAILITGSALAGIDAHLEESALMIAGMRSTVLKVTLPLILYMMVNTGAYLGPMLTLFFKDNSYDVVFNISGGMIALNFVLLLFYIPTTTIVCYT